MVEIKTQLQLCLERFRQGKLSEQDLQTAVDLVNRPKKQSILYIQAPTTMPHDIAIGMSIFEEGKDPEGTDENDDNDYDNLNIYLLY